jgi:hypothetical protein
MRAAMLEATSYWLQHFAWGFAAALSKRYGINNGAISFLYEQPSPSGSASNDLLLRQRDSKASGGGKYALDNLCNSSGTVAARTSEFLYAGRIHPHTACVGSNCSDSAACFWPQSGTLTILQ